MSTVASLRDLALDKVAGAQEVLDRLESSIKAVSDDISPNLFYTRKRVKSVESILNKIRVRQKDMAFSNYSIDEIGDVAGYRLVTLYDEQLRQVFTSVINTILASSKRISHVNEDSGILVVGPSSSPLFPEELVGRAISRIKVYRRSEGVNDFYNELLKGIWPSGINPKVAEQLNKLIVKEPIKDDSYSSIHISTTAISYDLGIVKPVPMEIQIRTAIEDIWSEVSHTNKYKANDLYFCSLGSKKSLESIKDEVASMKQHVNGISTTIENIRKQKKGIDRSVEQYFEDRVKPKFCSSLLNLANFQLGHHQDNRAFSEQFEQLDEILASDISSDRKQIRTSVFNQLDKLIKVLEIAKSKLESVDDKSADKEFLIEGYVNSIFLLNLELIRLKVFNELNQAKKVETLEAYLIQLEDIEKMSGVTINPRSLINFMKYMIVANSSDINSHLVYLSSSHDLLSVDRTLPSTSIARIRIAREYAMVLWREADDEAEILKRMGLNISTRVEGLKHRLLTAFKIILIAWRTHSVLSKKGELQHDIDSSSPDVELFYTRDLLLRTFFSLREYMEIDVIKRSIDFSELRDIRPFVNSSSTILPEDVPRSRRMLHLRECREYIIQHGNRKTKSFIKIDKALIKIAREVKKTKKASADERKMAELILKERK